MNIQLHGPWILSDERNVTGAPAEGFFLFNVATRELAGRWDFVKAFACDYVAGLLEEHPIRGRLMADEARAVEEFTRGQ